MTRSLSFIALIVLWRNEALAENEWRIPSPEGKVVFTLTLADPATAPYPAGKARLYYKVECGGKEVLRWSPLGIARQDQAFVDGLALETGNAIAPVDTTYTMPHGKRRTVRDRFNGQVLAFKNPAGASLEIEVRAYDDGAAFRYRFPEKASEPRTVLEEATGFRMPAGSRCWLHPYDKATEYSPAYETYYEDGIEAGTPSPGAEGWAFPVLFRAGDGGPWGLLTEAGLDRSYCGTHLAQAAPEGVYRIRFPDEAEGDRTGAVCPSWRLPWTTPWRVVIASTGAAGIVESNLVENVSPPSKLADTGWIKPGRASWSWLSDHDSPQDCAKLEKFVDLAAEMRWEYSLVDANWTIMKNGTIHDLAAHAKSKGVGLLYWYNSGGPHNHVSEKPRGLMDHRSIRRKELEWLRNMGVKGVKVDFFQSDKQNIIGLYQDILEDAAEFQIMVNFHGCTLPRGWSRTYPHLMSMEAVRGEECYSFDRNFTARAPVHNATLPFTRNAVGPMDYTPVMFKDNVYPHLTTAAHELALAVVFETGILHFAGGVEEYRALPEGPKEFLRRVPVAWEETRCLEGDPGRAVVIARRAGKVWTIGGINGRDAPRKVRVDLSFIGGEQRSMTRIEDGAGLETRTEDLPASGAVEIEMKPYGGFVLEIRPPRD